jgi:V8-like Glu-specific endopeptidase
MPDLKGRSSKMKFFIFAAALLALLISACSPPAAATADPALAQTSAAASIAAAAALTQSAVPTETPALFPTETPLPSPTDTPETGKDNCRHALDTGQAGATHSTIVRNETSGTISVSLTLYKKNAFGQCGYIVISNMRGNTWDTADLPAGSYSAYAWVKGKSNASVASGSFVVQPALSKKMEVCVHSGKIVYQSQC